MIERGSAILLSRRHLEYLLAGSLLGEEDVYPLIHK